MSDQHPWEIEVAEVAVSYSPVITLNLISVAYNFGPITLSGDAVLANPVMRLASVGRIGHIRFVQDSTGGRKLTFGDSWAPIGTGHVDSRPFATTIISYRVITPTLIDYWFESVVGPFVYTGPDIQPLFHDLTSSDWIHNVMISPPPAIATAVVQSILIKADSAFKTIPSVSVSASARSVIPRISTLQVFLTAVALPFTDQKPSGTAQPAVGTSVARTPVWQVRESIPQATATASIGNPNGLFQYVNSATATTTLGSLGIVAPGIVTINPAIAQALASNSLTFGAQWSITQAAALASANAPVVSVSSTGIGNATCSASATAPAIAEQTSAMSQANAAASALGPTDLQPSDTITGVNATAAVNSSVAFSLAIGGAYATASAGNVTTTIISSGAAVGSSAIGSSPVGG